MRYRILFLFGLISILTGQIILAKGNEFVYNQEPIDFAHWFLLIGAVLMIPHIITLPKSIYSYIGGIMVFIGIVSSVGMCVLDFIFWSFPDEASRIDFANHISNVPSIWLPFMKIGPSSKVLNIGLSIVAFNYIKTSKIGVLFVVIGTLILLHIIPVPKRLIFGYTFTLIGFSIIFLIKLRIGESYHTEQNINT